MKNIIRLLACAALISSCKKEKNETQTDVEYLKGIEYKGGLVTGNSICFSADAEGAKSYNWEFGDGQSSTEGTPCHIYTDTGTYTVRLLMNGNAAFTKEIALRVIKAPMYTDRLGGMRTWRYTKGTELSSGWDTAYVQPDVSFEIFCIDALTIVLRNDTLRYTPTNNDTVLYYSGWQPNSSGHGISKTLRFTHGSITDSFVYYVRNQQSAGGASVEYFYCP